MSKNIIVKTIEFTLSGQRVRLLLQYLALLYHPPPSHPANTAPGPSRVGRKIKKISKTSKNIQADTIETNFFEIGSKIKSPDIALVLSPIVPPYHSPWALQGGRKFKKCQKRQKTSRLTPQKPTFSKSDRKSKVWILLSPAVYMYIRAEIILLRTPQSRQCQGPCKQVEKIFWGQILKSQHLKFHFCPKNPPCPHTPPRLSHICLTQVQWGSPFVTSIKLVLARLDLPMGPRNDFFEIGPTFCNVCTTQKVT